MSKPAPKKESHNDLWSIDYGPLFHQGTFDQVIMPQWYRIYTVKSELQFDANKANQADKEFVCVEHVFAQVRLTCTIYFYDGSFKNLKQIIRIRSIIKFDPSETANRNHNSTTEDLKRGFQVGSRSSIYLEKMNFSQDRVFSTLKWIKYNLDYAFLSQFSLVSHKAGRSG